MTGLFLKKEDGNLIVFHLFKSLSYSNRMLISMTLIFGGILYQIYSFEIFPGIIAVFIGNLFLLTKGYNNNPDFGKYNPKASWQKVTYESMMDVVRLHEKMIKWDKSSVNLSSGIGSCLFVLIIIANIGLLVAYGITSLKSILLITVNIPVLLIPHWITGLKKTLTRPSLVNKINFYKKVIQNHFEDPSLEFEYNMQFQEYDIKIPKDIKIRVSAKGQPDDCMGMYCQIAMNSVQGTSYPYFYIVIVTKQKYPLLTIFDPYEPPHNLVKEYDQKGDVNVFILRQKTTKNSGYHTTSSTASLILSEGLSILRSLK